MYIIKMTESKQLINCSSHNMVIYQKESLVDKLLFLIPSVYKDIGLADFNVVLEYVDPVNVVHTELLVKNEELYKNYLAYTVPVNTQLTKYAGRIAANLSISKVDLDEQKHYVLHTGEVVIPIKRRNDYYNFAPDESLEFVDKIIANIDVEMQKMKEIAEIYDRKKADNLLKTENKIQLTANGTPIGDEIEFSTDNPEITEQINAALNEAKAYTDDSLTIVEF